MIHLDTHIVIWLYEGIPDRLTKRARSEIEVRSLLVSPMVLLELQYLFEVKRTNEPASAILQELERTVDLKVSTETFHMAAFKATELSWTCDPFDRLIAAHALADNCPLITADEVLLKNCPNAIWD